MTTSLDPLNNARVKALVLLLLAGLLLNVLWPAFRSPGQPEDEGITLVHPEMFLKGQLPYRDFENLYGPGNLLILSGAYSFFGANIFVERSVGLIYRLLVLVAIFGIAQRWGTLIGVGCALVAVLLLKTTEVWANTWLAATAFALCALWMLANTRSRARCFAAGLLGGIALLCRCDFAVALTAAILPLFVAMQRATKKWFLAGTAIGLLPLLYFAVEVGPIQLLDSLFLLPIRVSPGARLPILGATPDIIWVFIFYIAASAVNIVAGVLALRRASPENGRLLLSGAILGLGIIHYALSRFDGGHVLNAALVSVMLLPLSISVLFSLLVKPLPRWSEAVAVIALVLMVVLLIRSKPSEEGIFITQNGRSFPLGKNRVPQAADRILAELQRASGAGQFLFVGPGDLRRTLYCDTWIYHLFPQLPPASYFLYMDAGSANAPGSRLAHDIARADWLVLNRTWDLIPDASSEFGPDEPNRVVRADFDLWRESGPYLLLRNKRLRNLVEQQPQNE
jgi:hypothetical protein